MNRKLTKEEIDHFESASEKYLNEGINYSANTIKKADQGDLEQLASDSFETGWNEARDFYKKFNNSIKG